MVAAEAAVVGGKRPQSTAEAEHRAGWARETEKVAMTRRRKKFSQKRRKDRKKVGGSRI